MDLSKLPVEQGVRMRGEQDTGLETSPGCGPSGVGMPEPGARNGQGLQALAARRGAR